MAEWVAVREAARRLGLDPSVVSRQAAKWNVPRGEGGSIDLEAYQAARAQNVEPARQGSHAGRLMGDAPAAAEPAEAPAAGSQVAGGSLYMRAKSAREVHQARLTELQLKRELGELVDKAEVASDGAEAGRVLKEHLLTLPARVAADLAAETDPRLIEDRLEREIEGALEAMFRATSNGGLASELRGGDPAGPEAAAAGMV